MNCAITGAHIDVTITEVECGVCMETAVAIKLPRCGHRVCPKCYRRMQGFPIEIHDVLWDDRPVDDGESEDEVDDEAWQVEEDRWRDEIARLSKCPFCRA